MSKLKTTTQSASWRIRQMTAAISVILNLIQNQLDPDFRQDDSYGDDSVRQPAEKSKIKNFFALLFNFNLHF